MNSITTCDAFALGTWNINSIEYKSHGTKCNKLHDPEVVNYLNTLDCIGLLETHASQNTDISMPGFYVFRKDRKKHSNAWRSSGGIAVLVRESMRHIYKFDPVSDSDVIWVHIPHRFSNMINNLYIAFVYIPPLNSSYGKVHGKDIMQKIEKQIEYFSMKGKVIVCGDLNARVGNSLDLMQKESEPHLPIPNDNIFETVFPRVSYDNVVVNQCGRWLIDVCVDNQMYILNGRTLGDLTGQFTCHTPRGSSTVDYFLASSSLSQSIHSMKVNDLTLFSDHCMLTLQLDIFRNQAYNDTETTTNYAQTMFAPDRFTWSATSKEKYQEAFSSTDIQQTLFNINAEIDKTDILSLLNNITDVMVMAGDKAKIRRCFASKRRKSHKINKKWYDRDCYVLLRELKSTKNVFNRNTRDDTLRIRFYKKYKEYKKVVKFKKRKYKENLTNMLNDVMDKDPQTAWKIIDELKNDSISSEKSERINRQDWYNHFHNLLNNQKDQVDNTRKNIIRAELTYYEQLKQSHNLDFPITKEEIFGACQKLKNNKASAYDLIRNEMIKTAFPFLSSLLVRLFNNILSSGQFPAVWTDGIIIPVHKHGDCLEPNNYRGITLSSCLGKLFCHVLNNRIQNYLESQSFLKPEQAGFRHNFRTSDHIFVLKTIVDKYVQNCKNGSKLYACFIDLRKAFDTVWHEGLFFKLQKAGIDGNVYKLLKSMYTNAYSRVRCKHVLSNPIHMSKGVHQGNILSPILFNIFINDIGNRMYTNDAPLLHDSKINHLLYADDLLLLSTSPHELQYNIDRVSEFCRDWGLSINIDKSKIMLFSKSGRLKKETHPFIIGNKILEYVNQYKYLGVNISSTGKFLVAEKTLSLKASRALFSIKQSVFHNHIKPSVLMHVFDSLIKPIALYNSDIWLPFKTCNRSKSIDDMFEMSLKGFNEFDKIHTKFLKFSLGVHSKASNFAAQSELGRFPLIISCITACINFWLHVIYSKNDALIFKAYQEQINSTSGKHVWLDFVRRVLNDLGFSHVWNNQCTFESASLILSIRNKLKDRYILFWKNHLNCNSGMGKLRTYKLIKHTFGTENYLNVILDRKVRKCLTAFRISAHKLQIERGRYTGKNVEERLCTTCNDIEDEIHFFCKCSKYQTQRNKLFYELSSLNFSLGNNFEDCFIKIMTSTNVSVIKHVSRFLYDCHIT